ncbi:DUF4199 domain-containing protein [Ulvibacter antarcticus]|uniref:Uncharacterized protein DUF4199 n=1 Tax=Ulvibacter antarcticus TaxID=442714 RepID=A0A3L9YYM1_9FLAO|nr:DUF4199 domain-containing protein [Ulvibacter antarcticus]RMA65756.1 uncharacterized protein DUF4199 [Ulvibacter antarcticus]
MSKIYTRYGILMAIALVAYFLLLKLFGLHQYPVFSAANGIIFGAGLMMAMRRYKRDAGSFKYEKGFQVGFMSGALASVIFTIFMAIYMYQIDTEFAVRILESWGQGYELGTFMLLFTIFVMGVSTSLVLSLAYMQLLKDSWNTPEGKRNTLK